MLATRPSTALISSMAVVASSTVASVSAWAMMTPDRSTPRWSFFQPRVPRVQDVEIEIGQARDWPPVSP